MSTLPYPSPYMFNILLVLLYVNKLHKKRPLNINSIKFYHLKQLKENKKWLSIYYLKVQLGGTNTPYPLLYTPLKSSQADSEFYSTPSIVSLDLYPPLKALYKTRFKIY